MEHAEHIAEAVSYTKDTFLQIDGIITWIKLFLAIIIPLISGFGLAIIKGGKLIKSGTMEEVKGDASLETVFLELEEDDD